MNRLKKDSLYNIVQGDCYKLLKKIPGRSVDLILTDPPYNLNPYSTGNLKMKWRSDFNNDIANWDGAPLNIKALLKEYKRILSPKGNIFIFTAYNLLGEYHRLFNPEFDTFQIMVWHKTNPPPKLRKTSFLNSCELICCIWNKGHTWNFTKQSDMHNFFESPICMGKERLNHPTQKPLALLKRVISLASDKNDTVLDNFMGVGSAGEASLLLGRKFIGFETEAAYFRAADQRLRQAQKHVLANQPEQPPRRNSAGKPSSAKPASASSARRAGKKAPRRPLKKAA